MRTIEVDGLRVSRIGLGTWQFGSREWGYGDDYLRGTAPALLRRALELGITMMGISKVRSWALVVISFSMNFLGILLVAFVAHSL